jgi:hypothetical protein
MGVIVVMRDVLVKHVHHLASKLSFFLSFFLSVFSLRLIPRHFSQGSRWTSAENQREECFAWVERV